jgi:methyl coenzyme M reductase system subunit A2
VKDICDRLALMRGGKIVQVGPTAEVLASLTDEEREIMGRAATPGAAE